MEPREWKHECDLCKEENLECYIDGRMQAGPWANMCLDCHKTYGVGLGIGKGQKYLYAQGKYKKIEG